MLGKVHDLTELLARFFCATALAVFITGVPIVARAADWPAFRGGMHRTGYYDEPVGYPSTEPLWIKKLGAPIVSSPSVAEGILYVGCRDSCLYAIDAITGQVLWKRTTGGWIDSSPLVHGGKVFVGSRDGSIYVFDRDGKDIARLVAGLQLSSPAILANGQLVSGSGYPLRDMSAYDWAQPKWQRVPAAWSVSLGQLSYSSPAVRGAAVVLAAADGRLYGIDASSRRISWEFETDGGVYLSTPAVDEQTVYFAPGNYDRNVYAVGLLDGKLMWKSEGSAAAGLSKKIKRCPVPPARMMQLLRLRPEARHHALLRCMNVNAGGSGLRKRSARRALSGWMPLGGMKTSSVAVGRENVYVVQKALGLQPVAIDTVYDHVYMPLFTLIALDKKTGREQWRHEELRGCVRLGYCSSPLVTKHSVFFGWGEGFVYGLDNESGEVAWTDTLSGDVISSPAVADGHLYFATMAGDVYCYAAKSTALPVDFQQSTYCYPNPAPGRFGEHVSNIQIFVPRQANMTMTIYNMADRPVAHIERRLGALEKWVYQWQLGNVANGVYFARIKVKYTDNTEERKTLKIAVLR